MTQHESESAYRAGASTATASRIWSPWLLLTIAAALAIQIGLYELGLYHVAADDSARILLAHNLSWTNALEPWIWPPFYKVFVGVGLHIYGDIFLVPRVLVSVAGIVTLVALVFLSDQLFEDRAVNLGTAALAVFVHHRLVLSVAPMADIYYFMFMVISASFVMKWLRDDRRSSLLFASLALCFAATVRYEACFFIACLMLILAYRLIITRDLDFMTMFMASAILMFFPIFWALDTFIWYGSLRNLSDNRDQVTAVFGADHLRALSGGALARFLLNVALTRFLHDLLWNPFLLLGVSALFLWVRGDGGSRVRATWTFAYFAPLVILSAVMIVTMSVPLAAPWRISGIWTLLLLPFTSLALARFSARLQEGRQRGYAFAAALLVVSVPFAARSGQIIHQELSSDGGARAAALYLTRQLAGSDHGKVLLDSVDNYNFLHVLAESDEPEAFVLNAGDDPEAVANYMPLADKFRRENNTLMIERYLTDRFDLDRGGSARGFAANDIRFVLVRNKSFIDGLNLSPVVERVQTFGEWTLYRVAPEQPDASPVLRAEAGTGGAQLRDARGRHIERR